MDQALELANGRVVTVAGEEVTIDTAGAETYELAMNPFQSFLHLLSDPNIAFILITIGFYGLLYEVISPNYVTGIVGAIAIVLAFIGFGSLPLNVAGLLLIALGVVMFLLEFHVVSHGLLTVAGIVCFALGASALYTEPGSPTAPDIQVDPRLIFVLTGLTAAYMAFVLLIVVRWRRRQQAAGAGGDRARARRRCDRLGPLDARADGGRLCGRRGMDGARKRRAAARPPARPSASSGRMASPSSSSPSKRRADPANLEAAACPNSPSWRPRSGSASC